MQTSDSVGANLHAGLKHGKSGYSWRTIYGGFCLLSALALSFKLGTESNAPEIIAPWLVMAATFMGLKAWENVNNKNKDANRTTEEGKPEGMA